MNYKELTTPKVRKEDYMLNQKKKLLIKNIGIQKFEGFKYLKEDFEIMVKYPKSQLKRIIESKKIK